MPSNVRNNKMTATQAERRKRLLEVLRETIEILEVTEPPDSATEPEASKRHEQGLTWLKQIYEIFKSDVGRHNVHIGQFLKSQGLSKEFSKTGIMLLYGVLETPVTVLEASYAEAGATLPEVFRVMHDVYNRGMLKSIPQQSWCSMICGAESV